MTPAELIALADAATPGPWATQRDFPLLVVPASQRNKAHGGATDPVMDAERYSQPIANVRYHELSAELREKFPHRRINVEIAKADARLIALAPDLARLCAEMGEALERTRPFVVYAADDLPSEGETEEVEMATSAALANLRELNP